MSSLDELIAFHEICQLKYRYVRALDTQDWPLLESCFTEDAVLWPNGGDYIARGRKEVMAMVKAIVIESFYSSHVVVHPEIEFLDANHAKGIWRLQDALIFSGPHPTIVHTKISGGEQTTGAAYYYDEFVKSNDAWRISSCGYVRIYESLHRRGSSDAELQLNPRRGLRTNA